MYSSLSEVRKQLKDHELDQIHRSALEATHALKSKECELIRALQDVDRYLVHRFVGYNSLYQYALKVLGLSEYQAYEYITVARKAREYPKLQEALKNNEITVSKARRISSVINDKNQMVWIEAAKSMPKRELEKAIAEVNPKTSVQEGARFVSRSHLEVRLCASEETYQKLEKVRDLLCQKKRTTISLDEALDELCSLYLKKHDPVEKAKRAKVRETKAQLKNSVKEEQLGLGRVQEGGKHKRRDPVQCEVRKEGQTTAKPDSLGPGRVQGLSMPPKKNLRARRIPAAILHKVRLRDKNRCQWQEPTGGICGEGRFTEIHHIVAFAKGGSHEAENLITLCSGHHQTWHDLFEERVVSSLQKTWPFSLGRGKTSQPSS